MMVLLHRCLTLTHTFSSVHTLSTRVGQRRGGTHFLPLVSLVSGRSIIRGTVAKSNGTGLRPGGAAAAAADHSRVTRSAALFHPAPEETGSSLPLCPPPLLTPSPLLSSLTLCTETSSSLLQHHFLAGHHHHFLQLLLSAPSPPSFSFSYPSLILYHVPPAPQLLHFFPSPCSPTKYVVSHPSFFSPFDITSYYFFMLFPLLLLLQLFRLLPSSSTTWSSSSSTLSSLGGAKQTQVKWLSCWEEMRGVPATDQSSGRLEGKMVL